MGMFAITGAFELGRDIFLPYLGIWQASLLTIIVVSASAAFIAFFPIRSLRATDARLDTLLTGSPAPQFVIDTNHRIIFWNRALEISTGIKASEIIGTTDPWRAFYPAKRPTLADLLVDGLVEQLPEWYAGRIGKSPLMEGAYESVDLFPTLGKTGAWFYFTAIPVRDNNGVLLGAVETAIDVTRRKRAEDALEANRLLLEDSMELAHMAYWEYDALSRMFILNDRFYTLYGTTAEREGGYRLPVDTFIKNFIHPEDIGYVRAAIDKSLASLGPNTLSELEHRIIRRDGEIRYISVRVRATRDETGRMIRSNGANQDVTEHRLAEIALKESEARFLTFIKEAAMRLKNPLEVVEGNLGSVVGDIDRGDVVCADITLQLRLQIKNIEQIRNNIIELNKAIVDRSGEISDASKKFLTE
jgi:PAS domain S-box-containing protein